MAFWLSLPVDLGSLKRIDYPKQICLAHPLSFECFHCSSRNTVLYFIGFTFPLTSFIRFALLNDIFNKYLISDKYYFPLKYVQHDIIFPKRCYMSGCTSHIVNVSVLILICDKIVVLYFK